MLCWRKFSKNQEHPQKPTIISKHLRDAQNCATKVLLKDCYMKVWRFNKDWDLAIAKILLKFKNLTSKGNVNGALKLLTDNMHSGILPLKETLELLYVFVMSHMRFRVNPHSIVAWMSRNSLLEAGTKFEG